jgi:L-rhamnose mutarotase
MNNRIPKLLIAAGLMAAFGTLLIAAGRGVSADQARAAVQKKFPNALVGAPQQVYSVEVSQDGATRVVFVDGATGKVLPTGVPSAHGVRYGSVLKVKPGALKKYSKLHSAVWPDVLKMITRCNIRNYSIYYKDGYLFSYFEYVGKNFDKDMAKMAADKTTQRWWAVCKPLQQPLKTRKKGEWWASMPELFHED